MVFQEYQDPKVGKYLRYGYWYSAHRPVLKQYERRFLAGLCLVIWVWFAFNLYQYIRAVAPYEAMMRDLASTHMPVEALHQSRAPQALAVGEAFVMPSGEQTADFAARASNPNERWRVAVDYVFSWPGGKTLSQSAFILPGGKTILSARGVTVNALPEAATLELTAVRWQWLRAAESVDRARTLSGQIVVSEARVAAADGASVASYTISNQSIYSFWQPRFLLAITRGEQIVAVGLNELPELPAAGQFNMEYRVLDNLAGASLEVYPLIDVLDSAAYHLPAGAALKL